MLELIDATDDSCNNCSKEISKWNGLVKSCAGKLL